MSTNSAAVGGEDKIGGYRIVRTLLPGQNSTVYEVMQESSSRRFALKQLLPGKSEDSEARKAFEFEAKLGMELSHPKLIRVYEYVKERGQQPYFVMDFFPSIHLRLPISQPSKYGIPRTQHHRIITQVATALAYMHDKGWVHRDVKPENILVNKTAEVRLIDYALAKRIPSGLGKLFARKPGCEGTLSYMSPEQIRREPPAPTADIYSFGIFCYELTTGRQPFRANSASELLKKHIVEQPSPPTVYNKEITPEFADLILKMIKKRPADRPASMHEILSQFNRMRVYTDDPPPQAGRSEF